MQIKLLHRHIHRKETHLHVKIPPLAQEASELQVVKSRKTVLERYGFVLAPISYSTLAVLWIIIVVGC